MQLSSSTFKAVWSDKVTISFDANGGSGTMEPVDVLPGSEYIVPECEFTPPSGMHFTYWSTGDDDDKIEYHPNGRKWMWPTTDTTLKAVREKIVWENEEVKYGPIELDSRVYVQGDVTLVLSFTKGALVIPKGINVPEGSSLTIKGTGKLVIGLKAEGSNIVYDTVDDYNAGIGGDKSQKPAATHSSRSRQLRKAEQQSPIRAVIQKLPKSLPTAL